MHRTSSQLWHTLSLFLASSPSLALSMRKINGATLFHYFARFLPVRAPPTARHARTPNRRTILSHPRSLPGHRITAPPSRHNYQNTTNRNPSSSISSLSRTARRGRIAPPPSQSIPRPSPGDRPRRRRLLRPRSPASGIFLPRLASPKGAERRPCAATIAAGRRIAPPRCSPPNQSR
jgi:hypothetical protein